MKGFESLIPSFINKKLVYSRGRRGDIANVLGCHSRESSNLSTSVYEVWLSLVERLVWDQDVACSNHVTSIFKYGRIYRKWERGRL